MKHWNVFTWRNNTLYRIYVNPRHSIIFVSLSFPFISDANTWKFNLHPFSFSDLSWNLFDCHVFSISISSDSSGDKRKVILWEIFMTFIEMKVCEGWKMKFQLPTLLLFAKNKQWTIFLLLKVFDVVLGSSNYYMSPTWTWVIFYSFFNSRCSISSSWSSRDSVKHEERCWSRYCQAVKMQSKLNAEKPKRPPFSYRVDTEQTLFPLKLYIKDKNNIAEWKTYTKKKDLEKFVTQIVFLYDLF